MFSTSRQLVVTRRLALRHCLGSLPASSSSSSSPPSDPISGSGDDASISSPKSKSSYFFAESMQRELKLQTGLDLDRVFGVAKRGQQIVDPEYRFVTDSELALMQAEVVKEAERKMQMPPVLDQREDGRAVVLDRDPALVGFDSDCKLVFTDITYGVHDRDRLIVVREADGTLREAEWDERDRLNQVYFPKEGRKIDVPAMFEPEKLQEILGPDKYEYVLDRNCVQFEPDHPTFVRTRDAVFSHVDESGAYACLSSTRHYGPMVFHLCWERRADDILVHYLKENDLERAHSLVRVYAMVHPESASAKVDSAKSDLEKLRIYIKEDSLKASKVHMCLESCLERLEEGARTARGVKEAHGGGGGGGASEE